MQNIYTPKQIIEMLIKHFEVENSNQLAALLGVERQQIKQMEKSKGGTVNHRIISALLVKAGVEPGDS